MTLITFEDGKPVMRDGKVATEQACCCNRGECTTDEDCTFFCCKYAWQQYSPMDCNDGCADGYTPSPNDPCLCDPTGLPDISTPWPCDAGAPQEILDLLNDPRGQVGGTGFEGFLQAFCCNGECLCECPPP